MALFSLSHVLSTKSEGKRGFSFNGLILSFFTGPTWPWWLEETLIVFPGYPFAGKTTLSLSHSHSLSLGESESFKKKKKRVEEEGEEEKEITSTPSNRLALLSSRDSPQQPGGAALEPSSFEKEPLFLSLSLSLSLSSLSSKKERGRGKRKRNWKLKNKERLIPKAGFLPFLEEWFLFGEQQKFYLILINSCDVFIVTMITMIKMIKMI